MARFGSREPSASGSRHVRGHRGAEVEAGLLRALLVESAAARRVGAVTALRLVARAPRPTAPWRQHAASRVRQCGEVVVVVRIDHTSASDFSTIRDALILRLFMVGRSISTSMLFIRAIMLPTPSPPPPLLPDEPKKEPIIVSGAAADCAMRHPPRSVALAAAVTGGCGCGSSTGGSSRRERPVAASGVHELRRD